jgi:signal transduction histidine kinase
MNKQSHPDPIVQLSGDQIHDLKNRLTVIKGISQLLDRQVLRSDWQRERIVERVQSLQDEVLAFEETLANYTGPRARIESARRQASEVDAANS